MKQVAYAFIALFMLSCSGNYYLCTVDKPVAFYTTKDTTKAAFYIPQGKQLIARKKSKKYRAVTYGTTNGYIIAQSFLNETSYSSKEQQYLVFNHDSTYTYTYPAASSSSGGSVYVKGYYRKDGTYVRPHTRSAPKRKG